MTRNMRKKREMQMQMQEVKEKGRTFELSGTVNGSKQKRMYESKRSTIDVYEDNNNNRETARCGRATTK